MPKTYDELPRDASGSVDWAAIGMAICTTDEDGNPLIVKREKVEYKGAMLLRVVDIPKAVEWLGSEPILAALDGQSLRVAQQDTSRTYLIHCRTQKPAVNPIQTVYERRLWDRIAGIRQKGATGPRPVKVVTQMVVTLPGGAKWTASLEDGADNHAELRSAWMADLIEEFGMEPQAALAKVAKMDEDGKFVAMLTAEPAK